MTTQARIGSLSLVAGCGAESDPAAQMSSGQEASPETGPNAAATPSPDPEGDPEVVATGNGEDIGKDEFARVRGKQFQQAALQAQMSGQSPDQDAPKKKAVESMAGTELLRQQEQMPADASEAAEMPSYEELKQQVVQEKEGTATQDLVEKLHADGDVEINIRPGVESARGPRASVRTASTATRSSRGDARPWHPAPVSRRLRGSGPRAAPSRNAWAREQAQQQLSRPPYGHAGSGCHRILPQYREPAAARM